MLLRSVQLHTSVLDWSRLQQAIAAAEFSAGVALPVLAAAQEARAVDEDLVDVGELLQRLDGKMVEIFSVAPG